MDEFEKLLLENKAAIEHFVKFKISSPFDAEDVLQEIYISAIRSFNNLESKERFKAWLIGIARNKINDYYRKKAKQMEIPLERITELSFKHNRCGVSISECVRETIDELADKDKQILYYSFFQNMSQNEIAEKLGIPIGTVKSRLHTAKQNFKEKYPYQQKSKGETAMKKLPEIMPEYKIIKSTKQPFDVVWEELMGWFLIPKLGEKLSWAMYNMPDRKMIEYDEMKAIGKAEVHGIEGIEIAVKEYNPMDCNAIGEQGEVSRSFVAQLTDTHCRLLAESHKEDGIKKYYTFLDGEEFHDNWGFGENNIGNETHIYAKGDLIRNGNVITTKDKHFLLDVVGCYDVEISGKTYNTVCVMDVETYNGGVVTEQFIDNNGRTVLWRRYNSNKWAFSRYNKTWSEMLPNNEKLIVNGETFVHWYDCITDYIL